jgi:hypothetical protein
MWANEYNRKAIYQEIQTPYDLIKYTAIKYSRGETRTWSRRTEKFRNRNKYFALIFKENFRVD